MQPTLTESDVGVYYILNRITKKMYIGSSTHISKRIREHKQSLINNKHVNKHLQNSWNKYGSDNFEFGVIDSNFDKAEVERLRRAEQFYIDCYESYKKEVGYNISKYAVGSGGYEVSRETRDKISKANTGKRWSDEQKAKRSLMVRGELNGFYGKRHTKETKRKIRNAALKRCVTQKQLDALNLGGAKSYTEETYKKLSEGHRGEKSGTSKLKEKDVIDILVMLKNHVKYDIISSKYHISFTQISRIKHKERWGYLYEQYPELYS